MTRKRYTKLLMACGISRNRAALTGRSVWVDRGSYRDDMACGLVLLRSHGVRWRSEETRRRCIEILHHALYGEVAHE